MLQMYKHFDYTFFQLSPYPISGNCQMLLESFLHLYTAYFIAKTELTYRAANRVICLSSVLYYKHTRLSAGSKNYDKDPYRSTPTETDRIGRTTSRRNRKQFKCCRASSISLIYGKLLNLNNST